MPDVIRYPGDGRGYTPTAIPTHPIVTSNTSSRAKPRDPNRTSHNHAHHPYKRQTATHVVPDVIRYPGDGRGYTPTAIPTHRIVIPNMSLSEAQPKNLPSATRQHPLKPAP